MLVNGTILMEQLSQSKVKVEIFIGTGEMMEQSDSIEETMPYIRLEYIAVKYQIKEASLKASTSVY